MRKVVILILVSIVSLTLFVNYRISNVQSDFTLPYKMTVRTFNVETFSKTVEKCTLGSLVYLNFSSLVNGSHPMGLIYDSKRKNVWMAVYPLDTVESAVSGVLMVNPLTLNVVLYKFPNEIDENFSYPRTWTITMDENGYLWISINGYGNVNSYPSFVPYLAKLDPENSLLHIYYIPTARGLGQSVIYYGGFIYYASNPLIIINASSEEVVDLINLPSEYDYIECMALDDGYIWVSTTENRVIRFNISAKTFDVIIEDFDHPRGLYADAEYVYVAEESMFVHRISLINKMNLNVSRIYTGATVTIEGTCYVIKTLLGSIWWTDNSGHCGVILPNGSKLVFPNISKYGLHLAELFSMIWISASGSAYTVIFNDIITLEGLLKCFGESSRGLHLEKLFFNEAEKRMWLIH